VYLLGCRARGVVPEPPAAGRFNCRVSPVLPRARAAAAARAGKSLNAWAIEHLQDAARVD
ncbi:MAG: toxin-antitoxin system HicB family antitoxin, partial [Gammaproteobacteria bacterium]